MIFVDFSDGERAPQPHRLTGEVHQEEKEKMWRVHWLFKVRQLLLVSFLSCCVWLVQNSAWLTTGKSLAEVSKFFCSLLFEGTVTSICKEKKVPEKSQNSSITGFLTIICLIMEVSGSVQIMTDPGPGGPKNYGPRSTTLLHINRTGMSLLMVPYFCF